MNKFTIFLCLSILVLTGCQQDDEIIDPTLETAIEKTQNKHFNSIKDRLMPTGSSVLDTENLQTAMQDSKFDDGGTLYLGPGTFLVHASLIRQALWPSSDGYNPLPFKGTIQGSGKDITIIKSVRGPSGEDFAEWKDPDFDFLPATLIIAGGEYVSVRDLNFEADTEIMEEWFYGNFGGKDHFTTGLQNYIFLTEQIGDTDIDNVYFKGSLDSGGSPEIAHLFQIWYGEGGIHTFKSSELENGKFDILNYNGMSNAVIKIGGNANEKVTLTNLGTPLLSSGVQFWGYNNNFYVSNLETNNSGIYSWIQPANTLSKLSITNSYIQQIPNSGFSGIETWVSGGEVSTDISKNKIYSEDSFLWGPIFSEGVKKSAIMNNKFLGRGSSAIYLSMLWWSSGNATLVGNNFSTWENTGVNPWGFTAAPIWLGPYITDSFVVGGNNKLNVFDEPEYDTNWNPLPPDEFGNAQTYDSYGNIIPKNNIFTGVNNMHMKIGQGVRDAMKEKGEAKKAMMNNRKLR